MKVLINFFALQPTFTYLGIQVVWYAYLANMMVQSYISVAGILQALEQRGIGVGAWAPNFLPIILSTIVQLLLVRLLLEVAATILLGVRPSRAPRKTAPETL